MTDADPGTSAPAGVAALVLAGLSRPGPRELATAAAVAAAVLAATSTGAMVVAALLIGIGTLDRRSGAAVVLATTSVSIRFGTATFDDLAGLQSVLGPAVAVGPELAAASAWCAGGAVLLATRLPPVDRARRLPWRLAPPLATGLFAAALVAGPGPDDLGLRVGASAGAVLVAAALTLLDRHAGLLRARMWLALLAGAASCLLAGWPT